ncbi:MAG: class C sortase [Arachnia sp.]
MRAPRAAGGTRRRGLLSGIVLQLAAMIGMGLLLYPTAADWVSSLKHDAEISGYVERVRSEPTEQRQRLLDAAYAYNDELDPGPLTDPYVSLGEDAVRGSDLYRAYEEMLRLSGTDAIGTLSYPAVGIGLPIFHGTADEAISHGIGHLYGTSLPVGGPSTHSVLTSHSGLPNAQLFTPLHRAAVGDTFWISVLGEDHHYRVERIETVEPGDTKSLRIIEGEDWVTLFTCTPVGVNSHRLMLHAQRIPDAEVSGAEAIPGVHTPAPGFPWWAVGYVAGSLVTGVLLLGRPRSGRRSRVREQDKALTV